MLLYFIALFFRDKRDSRTTRRSAPLPLLPLRGIDVLFSVLCRISLPVRTGSHPTERRPVIAAPLFHDELLYETLRIGYDLE
ncbi:hypothetical protein, partial [Porphyromonas gingivalis]